MTGQQTPLGWLGVMRLGLVQASLGAIVVLTTSTLNRVMVVELALPAVLPGLLVALHYAVQVSRPRMGHGSDQTRRCTPWILGGMVTLAVGGWLAALATTLMGTSFSTGVLLAVLAFVLIGLGVAASGTSLLVLLAKRVPAPRRAAAATTVWMMMIAGFVVTAGVSGSLLDPYSPARLLAVAGGVAVSAVLLTVLALWGMEGPAVRVGASVGAPVGATPAAASAAVPTALSFRAAVAEVWADPKARRFTLFVFAAMLAFSAQDLILEPFAGAVLGYSLGASTRLSGVQHAGTFVGMLLAALAGSGWAGRQWGGLRAWTVGGCLASAVALAGLALAGVVGPAWPFKANVWLLGLCTGAFSIAAIGSMMRLAGEGPPGREGVRMGLWGAAQALAFGGGGLLGTAASDVARRLIADTGLAYALVFVLEAGLFVLSARIAARIEPPAPQRAATASTPAPLALARNLEGTS